MTELGFSKQFDKDISGIISEYLIETPVKIKDYFLNKSNLMDSISWSWLCQTADKIYINYIYDYYRERIHWKSLCKNSNAMHILKNNKNKLSISGLLFNKHPNANDLIIELINDHIRPLKLYEVETICALANEHVLSIAMKHNNFELAWTSLSKNQHALDLLELNPDKIEWLIFLTQPSSDKLVKIIENNLNRIDENAIYMLSRRNDTMHILENNPHLIDWILLSSNQYAIDILEKNIDKICWHSFSCNPHPRAIELLEKNIDNIIWSNIFENENEKIIELVDKYYDRIINFIDIQKVSSCSTAINVILKNIDKIDWDELSYNPHPKAIELLEKNIDKINWYYFTYNKNTFHLKNKYIDKLHSYNDINIIFENDQNKYNTLKKGYTKLIYNM